MTNETYFETIHSLNIELQQAMNAEPFDGDAYKEVIAAINRTTRTWTRRRRKFSCWSRWIIWLLLGVLTLVVWTIVF